MIITAKGTFTDVEALDFTTHELNWAPQITQQKIIIDIPATETSPAFTHTEDEFIDNPISMEKCITDAFKTHIFSFFDAYQTRKEAEAVSEIQATLEATKQQAKQQIEAQKANIISVTVE